MASTDFETNPICFTLDPKAGIMLSTTFVKVVCWDDTVWGYSDKSWTIARFPGPHTKRVRYRLVQLGKHSEELLLG